MKKIINKVLYVALMIIFPGIVFGETVEEGMDMKLYRTFLSYGLLLLIIVIFSVLVYSNSGEQKSDPEPSVNILPTVPEIIAVYNNTGLAGIMKSMSVIYYAVILLIAMYVIMLGFSIL
jgi:hypothetical protein